MKQGNEKFHFSKPAKVKMKKRLKYKKSTPKGDIPVETLKYSIGLYYY